MDNTNSTKSTEVHIPIIIGNYAPFRLVLRDQDSWEPTLEQINDRGYDYVKLSRLSCFIDVGITPVSLGIGFDGSLILPATKDFNDRHKATDKFNETLGILLLGGVYSEAIQPNDIAYGSLYIKGYAKNYGGGTGQHTSFHKAIRSKFVNPLESIRLLDPQKITTRELEQAYTKGKGYYNKIGNLMPSLYLNGTSNYVLQQWTEALIFLWTSIEQVINTIWIDKVVSPAKEQKDVISGRNTFLEDHRTWTSSTRIELLYHKGYIGVVDYQLLNIARKTRNDFIHNGKSVTESKVEAALEVLFRLMSLIITDYQNPKELNNCMDLVISNRRGELYPKEKTLSTENVTHWISMPPLPGDSNWGDKEFEIIPELVLQPL